MSLKNEQLDKDFAKFNDRDSVDTLELLKENTELAETETQMNSPNSDKFSTYENDDNVTNSEQFNSTTPTDKSMFSEIHELNESQKSQCQNGIKAIEYKTHFDYGFDENLEVKTDDLMDLEPKLREAWIEMRKLDRILQHVSQKEKRIKEETKALMEKNRVELELLKLVSDRKESKTEEENTAKYLQLSYFDSNINEIEDVDEDVAITPVFKTQIPDTNKFDEDEKSNKKYSRETRSMSTISLTSQIDNQSVDENVKIKSGKSSKRKNTMKPGTNKQTKQKQKDFIKRNIKLAQDAGGGTLAMTDEEKKRLNELLSGYDKDDESGEKTFDEKTQLQIEVVEYDPLNVMISNGEGFLPIKSDEERLKQIDEHLESRNYSRILTGNRNSLRSSTTTINASDSVVNQDSFRTLLSIEKKKIKLDDDFDENSLGDKFIREARVSREQLLKLKSIDSQLELLRPNSTQSDQLDDTNRSNVQLIDEETLQNLLDECSLSSPNVVSLIHNHKLTTLTEENLNEENEIDSNYPISEITDENDIQITDDLIKSLLEQAKSEGIWPVEKGTSSGEDDTHSYYEQALEVIRSGSTFRDLVPCTESEERNRNDSFTKLPKIESFPSNESIKKSRIQRQTEVANVLSRTASASSQHRGDIDSQTNFSETQFSEDMNSPTQSASFLPKIDTRFLPNITK